MKKKAKPRLAKISIDQIAMEDGAKELLQTPEAQPYKRLAKAFVGGQDLTEALLELAAVPLEKRYLWRVASALKWAFVDLEDLSVAGDLKTLSRDDLDKVWSLLQKRPFQFCLFMKALVGPENMERMMTAAIEQAKAIPVVRL